MQVTRLLPCSRLQPPAHRLGHGDSPHPALGQNITRYTEAVALSQDIFLGVLGHDLRDPLNSIAMGTQLLMQAEDQDSRSAKLGRQMYSTVLRMNKMLDNLLNFTQCRIGDGLQISPGQVDLAKISNDVVEEFRLTNTDRIIHNQTEGDCTGNWDAGRLSQTYQNLISNALQYSHKKSAIFVETKDHGDYIVFTVKNDGIPIPEQNQNQIFDLMHRIPNVDAERNLKKNLGLGLYIVREIVTAHRGSISVSSTEENGTTFRIQLPKE